MMKNDSTKESRLSARKTLRTITTDRGTEYDVFAESDHYIMCHAPINNRDVPSEAILDLEYMAKNGYFMSILNTLPPHPLIMFEKRDKALETHPN